ncbi:hypothetical protein COEREDRAFT_97582 [Coemansia reversa NRRL 1564]|uniref:G-protein coupled receptors family 3 profile domain-containing protein n=1 Tax=Coemansia reversa (strain ATCC 12441 / NRRL 1564) TaxID=763665 RepID=A0A2G5BBQ5_COERN|nr:hypothetical protein COEREDRAFT_97582 [Coemansia reversa NRRL 1564]|eukprot:PIA16431.1 hypothetical protein COEREDRAFT_97582 [Coemansia reversa NRRL 1564]
MSATGSGTTQVHLSPALREVVLSAKLGIKVTNPNGNDTATMAACGAIYGVTAIMLVYAWCNYNYRPIKAKNLVWITLIYISGILWFVGDIAANGHVWATGVWSHCKPLIIWLRVMFCFMFASLIIVRFFALDRVFNQRKPFTTWGSLLVGAIVVVVNVIYCLVNQLVSDSLTVEFRADAIACNVTQGFRIAAIVYQWVQWAGCAVLIYRLRNIQSSFNEFRESIAVFLIAIALLIESTVTYIAYEYYALQLGHRIQKTVTDTIAANAIIWLIIGYPVFMSIFRRRQYEKKWIDRLANDSSKTAYEFSSNPNDNTTYAKMNNHDDSVFDASQLNFGANETIRSAGSGDQAEFIDPGSMRTDSTVHGQEMHDDENLPIALRTNLHIRRPMLNNPSLFANGYSSRLQNNRRMI